MAVKVGDKVRIRSSGALSVGYPDGSTATVKCVKGDCIYILDRSKTTRGYSEGGICDCGDHHWVLLSNEYTKIDDHSTTAGTITFEPGTIISGATLSGGGIWGLYEDLSKPKKTLMTKLTNMIKKFLDADAQALVEAGFINGDLELTEAGRRALTEITFDKYKADLVAVAKAQIEEAKKKD